ncbi:protein CREG1-like [Salvia hispanica]|uniref:protein CREG1-like n=1 Tax=Salvia hispanica TaxID=49212 RepID=UPI00200951BC|nr:protein CREG1-like [Salvia hispanica]
MAPMKILMLLVVLLVSTTSFAAADDRPDVDDVPRFARWLVHQGKWGVISTNSPVFVPHGYIASYADAGTGSPYFYLSTLDPVGMVVPTDSRASLTVTEISFDGCRGQEAQNPSCAKISLSGELLKLPGNSKEGRKAERALFKAHPSFSGFPKMNGTFAVYKLLVDEIFLVNKMAPPRELTVEEYFEA